MWVLAAGALLAALGTGSTQLVFKTVDFVERDACNDTIVLPCLVTNLKENNTTAMHVSWKKEKEVFFSFHGPENITFPTIPTAKFLCWQNLSKGVASLQLKSSVASDGNYSCVVTELNREGETTVELRTRMVNSCSPESTPAPEEECERQFNLVESAVVSALLFLIIILCWAQLGIVESPSAAGLKPSSGSAIAEMAALCRSFLPAHPQSVPVRQEYRPVAHLRSHGVTGKRISESMSGIDLTFKYETVHKKKMPLTVASCIFAIIAVVAVVLFVRDGSYKMNQIGLAFIVLPAVLLMVLQYYIFKMALDELTNKGCVLIGFQILGYIVAMVGFGLNVSTCPAVLLSVVIAGLVTMAVADLLALAYVCCCSRMKDHHTPRKAVEEQLNELKTETESTAEMSDV